MSSNTFALARNACGANDFRNESIRLKILLKISPSQCPL
jgi:hypothetical protein